jgi:hypothetical protein
MRSFCVALLLVALPSTAAAASPSPLYGYDRGSYSYAPAVPLVRAHGGVFPDGFLALLADECRNSNGWEKTARDPNLKDSKAATNWASMAQIREPRGAAEMAMAILYEFAFPGGAEPEGGIAGGEWWVQMRNSNENIGFHVDKDEGIASEEQWMKMPVLSTVTYLTDVGGPTLVLNQSSNRGGNKQEPELPVKGVLVYPKKNRHMLFRGNLQHGVVGEFGQDGGERITFLVNWWDKRPMAPYCVEVSDHVMDTHIRSRALLAEGPAAEAKAAAAAAAAAAAEGGSVLGWVGSMVWGSSSDSTADDAAGKEDALTPQSKQALWTNIQDQIAAGAIGPGSEMSHREMPEPVHVPTEAGGVRRVDIRVPPRKRYNFPVPATAADGITFAGKVVEYNWRPKDVGGILHDLDASSRMCLHLFENVPGIKVVIFRDGRNKDVAERFDLDVSYKVGRAFLASERFGGPQVYAANTRGGHRYVNNLLTNTYGGKPRKTKVMVAAMVVDGKRRRAYYRMRQRSKSEAPPVDSIVSWVNKLAAMDADTLKYDEVRSGKQRKRGGGKKKKKRKKPRSQEDDL